MPDPTNLDQIQISDEFIHELRTWMWDVITNRLWLNDPREASLQGIDQGVIIKLTLTANDLQSDQITENMELNPEIQQLMEEHWDIYSANMKHLKPLPWAFPHGYTNVSNVLGGEIYCKIYYQQA